MHTNYFSSSHSLKWWGESQAESRKVPSIYMRTQLACLMNLEVHPTISSFGACNFCTSPKVPTGILSKSVFSRTCHAFSKMNFRIPRVFLGIVNDHTRSSTLGMKTLVPLSEIWTLQICKVGLSGGRMSIFLLLDGPGTNSQH